MKNVREQDAAIAYLTYLLHKGASRASLAQREKVLAHLDLYIASIPNNGVAYRDAVEKCLTKVEKQEWPFYLSVIREYFMFWTGNTKMIASAEKQDVIETELQQWQTLEVDLKSIWSRLDKERFDEEDRRVLEAYRQGLQRSALARSIVDTRLKLARLLLLKLRGASSRTAKIYRKAVDATIPVFELKDTRNLFLLVVREFYYFWINQPNAADYIFRETQSSTSAA